MVPAMTMTLLTRTWCCDHGSWQQASVWKGGLEVRPCHLPRASGQDLRGSLDTNSPGLPRLLSPAANCSLFAKAELRATSTMRLSLSVLLVTLALCCYEGEYHS